MTIREQIADMNGKVFPMHIILLLTGIAAGIFLIINPGSVLITGLVKFFMFLLFLWITIINFVVFKELNKEFVGKFLIFYSLAVSVLFLLDLILFKNYGTIAPNNTSKIIVGVVMLMGLVIYALVGVIAGEKYKTIPYFGISTCASTIYAIAILTYLDFSILGIPALFLTSFFGIATGLKAGVTKLQGERFTEDFVFLVAGIYGFVVFVIKFINIISA